MAQRITFGNLLAVDGGANAAPAVTFTTSAPRVRRQLPAGQLLTNTAGTRIGGLSVSPDNSKIAVAGFDSGTVIVYDYTAGNTLGAGHAVANKRETAATLTTASTQGTVWKDNSTVLSLKTSGELYEVAVTAGSATASLATTLTAPSTAPTYTSLAFNTAVSPYVWAMASSFVSSTTQNTLYVLDPAASYGVIGTYDLSSGVDTAREINLDKDGNLFVSANGSKLYVLPNAAATAASLNTGSIVQWNTVAPGSAFASFNGFDIGFAAASSGRHRVLPPQPDAPHEELVSLVFFFELDHDAVVTPLEPPVGRVGGLSPVVAAPFLKERLDAIAL